MQITTNNVPRDVLTDWDLTESERSEFDYLDLNAGEGSFFRYRGIAYDLGEFTVWNNPESPTNENWDGFRSDSYFSGLVVRYCNDCEQVVVGLALS